MYDVTEYHFNREECWFKSKCPYYNKKSCCCGCCWYNNFYYLVGLANLPKAMTYPENQVLTPGKDANEHKYLEGIKDDIVNWVKEGNNLLLFSDQPGNGKTTWAIKLMCKYFSHIAFDEGRYYDQTCRGLFVNVDELMCNMRHNISRPDERFKDVLELIPKVDLVIWDDIGNTAFKDYDAKEMYVLIDRRIREGKANIYTSNVIDNDMQRNIGARIADRIIRCSDIIEFINPSMRQPKSRRK